MELRLLRYFVAVAEELHFTRAAERLHIGQPPLSQQIRLLEEKVGTRLLERTKRWVKLTPAGDAFLREARRILELADAAPEAARKASRGETGQLRIGFTSSTPLTSIFPDAVSHFRSLFPKVALSFLEMSTSRQMLAIERDEIDVGFVRCTTPDSPKSVALHMVRHDPLMVLVAEGHHLARCSSLRVESLVTEDFVMYAHEAGTAIEPLILRLCANVGFQPNIVQLASEATTIIGLVAGGCGISILPVSFQCIHVKGVRYIALEEVDPTLLMLATKSAGLTVQAEHFCNLMKEIVA